MALDTREWLICVVKVSDHAGQCVYCAVKKKKKKKTMWICSWGRREVGRDEPRRSAFPEWEVLLLNSLMDGEEREEQRSYLWDETGRWICVCVHTHTHTHTQNKNTLVPDSRVMACNYFLNGRPCVYQNVNVCIITGSTKPARMSRLPARQSGLKIEWQISMHCCHAALKLTNIRPVHRVELLYHGA